jgi:hypothetical protein
MPPVPSRADIEAIGAWPQPALRNLRIAQAYHELAAAVARETGPGANWCTFATWASRQAGQSIRGDDLGRKIEDAFRDAEVVRRAVEVIREVRRALGRAIDASAILDALREACAPLLTAGRVAEAVARGNKKVFDEIGLEFARFLAIWPAGANPALEAFCGELRPGHDLRGQFPLSLRTLADPDLVEFLGSVDPTGDSLRGTGASDWASLAERMHFIADLFRLQHASPTLFQPPFTPGQLRAIAAGRIPDGPL